MTGVLIGGCLGLLGIWAPYAFEQPKKQTYRSLYFLGALGCFILLSTLLWVFRPEWSRHIPWLGTLIMLASIDIKSRAVRVVDLGILSVCSFIPLPMQSWAVVLLVSGIVGTVLIGLKYLLTKWYQQNALGGADICVIVTILVALGGKTAIIAMYSALIYSAVTGLILMGAFKKSKRTPVPFIPFLTLGVITALFFSEWILVYYGAWVSPS